MTAESSLAMTPANPSRRDLLQLGLAFLFAPVLGRSRAAAKLPSSGAFWLLGREDF